MGRPGLNVDTRPIRVLSLFSGGGGLDLAIRLALPRTRTVCYCEREIAACEILAARIADGALDDAPIFTDICAFDGKPWRGAVDLIIGGFPCFAAGTLVLAREGYRPIETLAVGAEVLTHLGRWRRITSVMHRDDAPIRRIRGMGLPDIRTTDEHPFFTRTRNPRKWVVGEDRWGPRSFSEPSWVAASELGSDSYVGQVLPPQESRPGSDRSIEFWWLVGRYLADGWRVERKGRKSGRVVICCAEAEAELLHARIIAAGFNASRVNDRTAVKFHITKGELYDFLEPFGRFAHGKLLPGFALCLDMERSRALIEGWLSGDGHRYKDRWAGATVSRALALSMALLAQRVFGVVASVHVNNRNPDIYIEGRACKQRKSYEVHINNRNRSSFIDGNYGWKLIRSSVDDGVERVFNISVEEDESYVADGAIVHNCTDLSVAGKQAGIEGEHSGLWREYARVVREVQPRWVYVENVPPVLAFPAGRVVFGELAEMGFDAVWGTLRASDVGTPHKRERAFILAYRMEDSARHGRNRSHGEEWRRRGVCEAMHEVADAISVNDDRAGSGPSLNSGQRYGSTEVLGLFPPGPSDVDAWQRILADFPWLAPAVESGFRVVVDDVALVLDASRTDQLRAGGNGVVALQGALAFTVLARRAGLSEMARAILAATEHEVIDRNSSL